MVNHWGVLLRMLLIQSDLCASIFFGKTFLNEMLKITPEKFGGNKKNAYLCTRNSEMVLRHYDANYQNGSLGEWLKPVVC